jgi:hypothetical protein
MEEEQTTQWLKKETDGQTVIYITLHRNKCVVPGTRSIDRGEAEVNSQGRGDNTLAIPEYTVYKYFIIPKHINISKKFKIFIRLVVTM